MKDGENTIYLGSETHSESPESSPHFTAIGSRVNCWSNEYFNGSISEIIVIDGLYSLDNFDSNFHLNGDGSSDTFLTLTGITTDVISHQNLIIA